MNGLNVELLLFCCFVVVVVSLLLFTVANSAKSAEEYQKKMATLLKDHAEEVTQVKKQMRQQLESERKRLLNQIRELTIIKEQANAEVF